MMEQQNIPEYTSTPPKVVKENEWGRYNPGWVEVSEPGHNFLLNPECEQLEVTYLWIMKPGNDNNPSSSRIIIGFEAKNIEGLRKFLAWYGISNLSNEQLEGMLNMGHPTLSAHFKSIEENKIKEKTTVNSSYGEAYFGGELKYSQEKKKWKINNHSGRHSSGKFKTQGEWTDVLNVVAERLQKSMGIPIKVDKKDIKIK